MLFFLWPKGSFFPGYYFCDSKVDTVNTVKEALADCMGEVKLVFFGF